MIDRTQFAVILGIGLIVAFALGLAFLLVYISAKRADRMRSTRQRHTRQHWAIRTVAKLRRAERRFVAALPRRRSRRSR